MRVSRALPILTPPARLRSTEAGAGARAPGSRALLPGPARSLSSRSRALSLILQAEFIRIQLWSRYPLSRVRKMAEDMVPPCRSSGDGKLGIR